MLVLTRKWIENSFSCVVEVACIGFEGGGANCDHSNWS